uniref:NADH dehydrogenase subunit 6 n=1 Tax=Cyrtarachne nagasakiensis TaxID=386110 RepID=A0A0U2L7X2_9ARAC|nr:NADH dehydrogenase subunit 6 [Cyrtarachne nagasakiensis]ALF36384.1 NADH dehydrogenase subunit 6 [Cyrtarachne nagasakiensis]
MKMIVLVGMMFILSSQPMFLILSLIFLVMLYSLYMLWNLSMFWFSYMLVLVMMSGVLVIFSYMMSILPNESFEVSSLMILMLGMVIFLSGGEFLEFIQNTSLSSIMIWSGMMMMISMFLVIYLLFIMILVVWLSMMEWGAIRIA